MLVTQLNKDNTIVCGDYDTVESFLIEEEFNNEKISRENVISNAVWGTAQIFLLNMGMRMLTFFNCIDVIHIEKKPYTFKGFLHRYEEMVSNRLSVSGEAKLLTGYTNMYTYLLDHEYAKFTKIIKELKNSLST